MSSDIAIAWLPNSLLLAFFLIKDNKEWKYYIPFFIVAEIIADYPTFTLLQSLQFAFINILETSLGAFLIKKFTNKDQINFGNIKYVVRFFIISIALIPSISSMLGAFVYITQISEDANFLEVWRTWHFSVAVGILLLTPIMIMLNDHYKSLKAFKYNITNIAILILTIYISIELFSLNEMNFNLPTTPLLFILLILWIVYKEGTLYGLVLSFIITLIGTYYTSQGIGPFSIFLEKENAIYFQEFVVLLLLITLFFGALHNEIIISNKKLEDLNNNLEDEVKIQVNKLREKDALLSQQNKLASMGEMLGNIAHQWRQPLSTISTASTGAKLQKEMDCLSDSQLNSALTTINDAAQYLSQTIDDFRGFFNPKNNIQKEFYIDDSIDKTFKLLSSQFIANNIGIIRNIKNYKLESVENKIIQVLINIFNNASDALVLKKEQKRLIFIDSYQKDNIAFIEILDNAGGIKDEIINRVFEPYFTTKHKSQGTGIGLYMSQDIINNHLKGELTVLNENFSFEGIDYTGAKFIIKLPLK
jgi:signal transduction histidine kinase